jgi:biotin carboxylase
VARAPASRRRPRLLVLGAGPAQLGALAAARARDVHVIAADRDPDAIGFALADERALVSSEDEQALDRLARAREIDGVLSPGNDWPVGIAARIAERMGLPHPIDAATAVIATSKARQRERFAGAGVPQPRVFGLGDDEVAFPCVVKAVDRQGQRGLSLVEERSGLESAMARARAESRGGKILVEEFANGPELTVNAVSYDDTFVPLTVTDRVLAPPPAFGVAAAHVWPSAAGDQAAVVAAARDAVAAVGIRSGPSYTQVRLTPDGPRVMEVAARLGGGHDAELCEAALGVPLNDLAVAFALGEPPSDMPLRDMSTGLTQFDTTNRVEPAVSSGSRVGRSWSARAKRAIGMSARDTSAALTPLVGGACVVFLTPPVGRLIATHGIDEAEASAGVRWVRVYRRAGWRFGPLRTGADRAGAILAVGADAADALSRAHRAAEAVRFEVDADEA